MILAFLKGNLWRTGAIVLFVVGLGLLALRSCDDGKAIEEAREHGATKEREQVNTKVLSDAEKVAEADAAIRGGTVTERMRKDPNCRDCALGE